MDKTCEKKQIGFGTWPLGGKAYGHVSEEVAHQIIEASYDLGIRIFDTADIYGNGRAENILGSVVGTKNDVKIISKVGYLSENSSLQLFNEAHIRNSLENSLKRLNRSKIDYYFLHSPSNEILSNNKVLKTLEQIQKEGLIENLGVSLRNIDTYHNVCKWHACNAVEVIINLVDQRAIDKGFLEFCSKHNTTVFARLPLCSGFLTGKYLVGSHFLNTDVRSRWSQKQIDVWCNSKKHYRFLINPFRNLTQAALAFCLSPQVNAIPIPGMKTLAHVYSNVEASREECAITSDEYYTIRKVWSKLKHIPPL